MNENKLYPIGEIAQVAGVSVRTLQYYDRIGLLTPERISNNKRYYRTTHIRTLQSILFYKQLGFSIHAISERLSQHTDAADEFDEQLQHLELDYLLIRLKRSALKAIIAVRRLKKDVTIPETILTDLIKTSRTIEQYQDINFTISSNDLQRLQSSDEQVLDIYFSWKQLSIEALIMIENTIQANSDLGRRWSEFIGQSLASTGVDESLFASFAEQSAIWPDDDRLLYESTRHFIGTSYIKYQKENL